MHPDLITRLKHLVPASLRRLLRQGAREMLPPQPAGDSDYDARKRQELERFTQEIDVNDLPPIFHYWSNAYLRPLLESFGVSNPDQFFAAGIMQAPRAGTTKRILSIGAGNCDTEVRVAQLLAERGEQDWRITCLDLVPAMLERGRQLASEAGLGAHFEFVNADFNSWQPAERFDVVMANQCLHHVVELEGLFANIRRMLADTGRFVISDMIGRNGHQRWPEARALVDRFWEELPPQYRYNRQLQRQEDRFLDWDCAVEGFEGIRAQDILPLLCANFHFETFIPFGNIVDPFIDRGFGWNFNAEAEWDRDFIDRVHAADVAAIKAGTITPTHLMCVCTTVPPTQRRWLDDREPSSYIRDPAAPAHP